MLQIQDALTYDRHHIGLPESKRYWRLFSMWILGLAITLLAACGDGTSGSSPGSATSLAMPAGMAVIAGNGETTITWGAAAGATSYNIYRSTTQGAQGTKVGASSTTSYVDSTSVNGITYYYQVTADNAAGEGAASPQSAGVTPVPPVTAPPAPSGLSATPGNAQVTVSWTVVAGASSYNVYRSTNAGSQGSKLGSSSTSVYSDTTAVNGATYFYEVTADNAAGEGLASAQSSGATPTVPVNVPTAPTGVNATAGNAQVTVSWTGVTGAPSYNIYRSTSRGSQGSKLGSSSTTVYLDVTAVNGTTYYYAVTADNAAGEGPSSTSSSGATPIVALTAPASPTGVNAAAGNAQVTVTWTGVTGATSYNIYRSSSQGSLGSKIASSSTVTFADSSAVNGTTYYYVVRAANAAGESPVSTQSAPATPVIPVTLSAAPVGVNATAGNAQVTVTWTAAARATSYNIYRSTTQGPQGSKVGSSAAATYTDLAAVNGTTYYYVITAVNAAGESSASTQSTAATPKLPVVVPTAPTGVNATAGNAQVTVSWTGVTGVTSYNIYRSSSQGSIGTKIASSSNVTFVDSSAVNGTTYYYVVRAANAAGESPASTQSAPATPAIPVTLPATPVGVNAMAGNAQVTVSWTVAARATSYNIYRSTTQGSQGSKIGSSAAATYTDLAAVNGTTYYYVITAVNAAGESPASAQSAAATPALPVTLPAAPTGVNVADGVAQVNVTWTAVSGATSYKIYRSTTQGVQGTLIGSGSAPSYADYTAVNGTTYYYKVTASNTAGEGAASTVGTVTPSTSWTTVKMGGGGYVPGVIYHPTVANLRYARTDVAGVYRWDNSNSSWTGLTDGFGRPDGGHQGAESMAVDPTNANKVYMTTSMAVSYGNGRFQYSSDKGNSWNYVTLPFPVGSNNQGRGIGERMMVDPNLPSTLFYASRTAGLWKSTNYGLNWSQVTSLSSRVMTESERNSANGGSPVGVEFVVFDTTVPTAGFTPTGSATQTIYVGVAPDYKGLAGLSSYLYKSTDGGATWTGITIPSAVTSATTGTPPVSILPYLYIPHMVRAADGMFYVPFTTGSGPASGTPSFLYKFDGTTWTKLIASSDVPNLYFGGIGGLSVYGSGATTKIVFGVSGTWGDGVWIQIAMRSADGGQTWAEIGRSGDSAGTHNYHDASGTTGAAHPEYWGWVDDLDIDPFNPNHVSYVVGGGVWSTNEAFSTPTPHWTFDVNGIEEMIDLVMTAPPPTASYSLLSGQGDTGLYVHTSLTTGSTRSPNLGGGNGTGIDMAWNNPAYIAAVGIFGKNVAGTTSATSSKGVYSTDSGVTWKDFPTMPPTASAYGDESNVVVTANGANVILAIKGQVPYYTNNNGTSWTATNLPAPSVAYHIAADRKNPLKVYAYDHGGNWWNGNPPGKFYYSTDGGHNFTTHPLTWPHNGYNVTDLVVNPFAEGDIWLADANNLWHSVDSGATWTKLTAMATVGAEFTNVHGAIKVALGKPATGSSYSAAVYLIGTINGTDGVYRSDDMGVTWTRIDDDSHRYGGVNGIAADTSVYGRVFLRGRGMDYNF